MQAQKIKNKTKQTNKQNHAHPARKRVFLSLIIRHLEGKAKVFSTVSVNDCVNLFVIIEYTVCLLMQIPKM